MNKKSGVSMIVLAVTIAVMAILIAVSISFLEDTDIIEKSKETTKDAQLMQVKEIMTSVWNNANAIVEPSLDELQDAVDAAVLEHGIDTSKYNIIVTEDEIFVSRDFVAPIISSSSMSYTNTTATVNLTFSKLEESDYPVTVEYYIKKSSASNEAYSFKEKVMLNSEKNTDYIYTGLKQGTAYNIKAVVRDVNGNVANTTLNMTTSGEPEPEIATLGSLITNPKVDYGKTVDYTVTVDGTTYNDWRIYYHNSEYVYLVLAQPLSTYEHLLNGVTVASLSGVTVSTLPSGRNTLLDLYEIFRVGNAQKCAITDDIPDICGVAELIKNYTAYANTTTYGNNVIGSIGAPTIELFVEGWNAKGYEPTLTLTTATNGYNVNGTYNVSTSNDGLYSLADYIYWLASPSYYGGGSGVFTAGYGIGTIDLSYNDPWLPRPVVCLKASIPATVGTGTYDFNLVK
ncbi:MAG: hypothetical protein IKL68_05150 [Clostridia bacterium]|nr:hypothetical protein [Clostridia bacterium]